MSRRSKSILFVAGGAGGLVLLAFFLKLLLINPYSRNIPDIPDSQTLSEVVLNQIKEASSQAKRWPSAEHLGQLGMVYHSSANYPEAARCYKLALEKEKSAWLWSYYLGYLYREMGEANAAIEQFNRVIKNQPEEYLAWYYCGEETRNLGQHDQAKRFFEQIKSIRKSKAAGPESGRVDHFPLGTHARYQLARIYMENGNRDAAESSLKGILLATPTYGPAYRLLGNLYSLEGKLTLSEKYGVRANDLLPYSSPVDKLVDRLALLSKSELYLLKKIDEAVEQGYSEWALRLVKSGMESIPENRDLISRAVTVSLWTNHMDQALEYTDKHISCFLQEFNELQDVGNLFFGKEVYHQARLYFAKALLAKPGHKQIQKKLAVCLWHEGERKQSVDLLHALVENHPDDMELLAEVSEILLFELDQSQLAVQYIVLLDHFLPSNPKVQKMSAWMAQNKGFTQEAISLYEASFHGDPDDYGTIMNLGNLLISQKMWDKSIRHFSKALEYHPNEPLFLEKLASLLINCPDSNFVNLEEGKDFAERAFIHVEARPRTTISAGRSLTIAFANLGQLQNARMVINRTIELARRENFSRENMAILENLSKQLTNQS